MWSFIICLALLVAGYFVYGSFVERIFRPDELRRTPAVRKRDGVDYVPMPMWKVYMIQFLNIAGTGPIFGAIMGAKFGTSSYLWIVLGCIFAGAVHDYFSGMFSVRSGGLSLPNIVGHFFGKGAKTVMLVLSLFLLLLVGVVFVYTPAEILGEKMNFFGNERSSMMLWVGIIFLYYILATILPVDKIIGKIYPLFAIALIFMAISLCVCLFIKWPSIPEFWDGLQNRGPEVGLNNQSIFPCIFVTIACGALSGFHATQSPIMARCLMSEKKGRPVFYGAMITEGIVALIWAAVASYFFFDGGAEEVGCAISAGPSKVVTHISESWLGLFGGILAILGVVAAPITSGDTAFRSVRLVISDFFNIDQSSNRRRLSVAVPIFIVSALILWYAMADRQGFTVIWNYFGWANQTFACFILWTATAYLLVNRTGSYYMLTLLPASFITSVSVTFLLTGGTSTGIGFSLPQTMIPYIGVTVFCLCLILFQIASLRISRFVSENVRRRN